MLTCKLCLHYWHVQTLPTRAVNKALPTFLYLKINQIKRKIVYTMQPLAARCLTNCPGFQL